MADKETKLSIVIKTVDQATAKIQAINAKLDAATKPVRNLRSALGELREKSGLDDLLHGFSGVGDAITGLLSKVALIGGVAGFAVAGVYQIVKQFDDLGDTADRVGVSVNFLASMRYAAEKAGAPVEALDVSLQTLQKNIGQLHANTGRLLSFLEKAAPPAIVAQFKAAKNTEQAFDLLVKAMERLKNPTERAALAQAAFGDSSLAPVLAQGSAGLDELRKRYAQLDPYAAKAAESAGKVDDSMIDLHAAIDGAKGALITGLGPALKILIDKLGKWLTEHQTDIADFAKNVGDNLPGAVTSFVDAISGAFDTVSRFVDKIGGMKTVAIAAGAILAGPLASSILSLGVTLTTTPVGKFVGALGLLATAATLIYENWDDISDFFQDIWDGITDAFESAWKKIKPIVDAIESAVDWVKNKVDGLLGDDFGGTLEFIKKQNPEAAKGGIEQTLDMVQKQRAAQAAQAQLGLLGPNQLLGKITVEVKAPKDTRVDVEEKGGLRLPFGLGNQMSR